MLHVLLSITDKELAVAGKISEAQAQRLTAPERSKIAQNILELKLGQEKFNSRSPEQQQNTNTMVFGGCCCYKDLNVAKYGIVNMQAARKAANLHTPVLLANKVNQAVINLSDNPDSASLQSTIDLSEAGCIKLLELLGSLLQHKDGEWGYQDKCIMFMKDQKSALFDLQKGGKLPDTSNTQYQCYTYATTKVLSFHSIIQELVEETINAKVKSGHPNHIEQNVLKALNDPPTLLKLASLALYGASVSWQYMTTVCGTKEEPVNLLDLTPIHRKLPGFCENIAKNLHILFDLSTSPDQLTINGLPFEEEILIESIHILVPKTDNLLFKFHEGGTFDMLTPQQRKVLFLPSTNDHNEGMLGSYRVHMQYHPSSTPESFSNQTRNERNNTKAFIKKHCDASDHKYVMREAHHETGIGFLVVPTKALAHQQVCIMEKYGIQALAITEDTVKHAALQSPP
ncbi:hypothetical protein C8J56DRAFT_1043015 [Mycena floridula]|nr:hypothetical protein C8J56DRAFT_1043015 [Mycena floridula]